MTGPRRPPPLDLKEIEARHVPGNGKGIVAALLAHCRALRVALYPFAHRAKYWAQADAGTMMHTEWVTVEVAHLQRAAAVLALARDEEAPREAQSGPDQECSRPTRAGQP